MTANDFMLLRDAGQSRRSQAAALPRRRGALVPVLITLLVASVVAGCGGGEDAAAIYSRLDSAADETLHGSGLQVVDRRSGVTDCTDALSERRGAPYVAMQVTISPDEIQKAVAQVEPLWRDNFELWFGQEGVVRPVTDGVVADSDDYHLQLARTTLDGDTVSMALTGPCGAVPPGSFTIPSAIP